MNVDVEAIIREYIEKSVHMSLATTKDGKPWVCELHFAYDEKLNLYFRSLKSRRHSQEIVDNASVAGNIIDKYGLDDPVVGIYFEGKAELLPAGASQDIAFTCLKARLQTGDDILEEAQRDDGHQFYKISIENWYAFGRFGQPSGQKYTLNWNGGVK